MKVEILYTSLWPVVNKENIRNQMKTNKTRSQFEMSQHTKHKQKHRKLFRHKTYLPQV